MFDYKADPAAGEKRPLGIYLHIPFCRQKCLYCDFLSAPAADGVIARYVDALCCQIGREAKEYRDFYVRTVFFGGGTPSLLSAGQIRKIMAQIKTDFELGKDAEVTMESNPGTLDEEKLAGCRAAGINRLSIGLQSAQEKELKALGRIHDYDTFLKNYKAARKAGFTNINVDLMSALPGQTVEGWLDTLCKTAALSPEHISAYSLIIEEGTPFFEYYGKKTEELPSEEEERTMYEQTQAVLKQYGYHRYEISNYAKAGKECLHNIGYWDRTDYVGFGLGAASMVNNVRWKITDSLTEYLRIFDPSEAETETGKREVQPLSVPERMEEFMFLGLRMTAGVSAGAFREQFGAGIREIYGNVLDRLEEEELILFYDDEKRLKLTPRGIDVSNYVLAQFLLEEE
ncbi:MAG: radical SAM family heme chaperone HemW [Eubacteriales bacterium]|nr:radical SAM family heme chaperone HemW [Eubacteriales bacterium]